MHRRTRRSDVRTSSLRAIVAPTVLTDGLVALMVGCTGSTEAEKAKPPPTTAPQTSSLAPTSSAPTTAPPSTTAAPSASTTTRR